MKVGDLVRYRCIELGGESAIAVVVGTTNHSGVFDVLELTGPYKGQYNNATDEDWEVISGSR